MTFPSRHFCHRSRTTKAFLYLTFALLIIADLGSLGVSGCPSSCTCTVVNRRGGREERNPSREGSGKGRSSRREVVCSGRGLTTPIDPESVPKDTVRLDLSDNRITSLRQNAFSGLSSLLLLNLSGNHIMYIEPRAFDGLDKLQNLDLSRNQLGGVNNSMFVGLEALKELNISHNQISTVAASSFERLQQLQNLDFASDYLVCDCQMKWIVRWMKNNKVRIADRTVCAYPKAMKGEKVRQLKRKELHCEWPLELPMFELVPDDSQMVVKGDTIHIECSATYLEGADETIVWFKSGRPITTNITAGINITTRVLPEQARIRSTLLLYKIQIDTTSIWEIECQVMTSRGSMRKRVTIIIIDSNDTRYCPATVTQDNKGAFNWPRTISGLNPESIICPHGAGTNHMGSVAEATRKCNLRGLWDSPDTSQCEYASKLTRKLESASMMRYGNATTALPIASEIVSSTSDPLVVQDRMDITFIARTLDSFSRLQSKELGRAMIDIASNLMEVDPTILKQSQAHDQSCSKIILALERLAREVLRDRGQVFNHQTANIAMEVFNFDTATFTGMACASFRLPKVDNSQQGALTRFQDFRCFMGSPNMTRARLRASKGIVEAAIQLPGSIVTKVTDESFRLQFFVYKNAALFPSTVNSSATAEDRGRRRVTSPVISSQIAGFRVRNNSSPIILHFLKAVSGQNPVPGHWDFDMRAWRTSGCVIVQQSTNMTTVHCNHLTNFALLMHMTIPSASVSFRSIDLLHPAIYVGSLIFVVFVFLTMVSYICFNSNIRLKRKCRHSLMNTCFGFLNLVMFFAGGINRTEPAILCRIVGIGIHYFSLCCLLWIGIGVRNLYKGLTRKESALPPGEAPPPPRPILRFYFVGWGIPMIVVGITAAAAANIGNYGGEQICWMDFHISLAACFGVAGFFVVVICLMMLVVGVRLGCKPSVEAKGPTMTDPDQQPNMDAESVVTHRTVLSTVSSVLDGEYSYSRQLNASLILLLGFLITWAMGALAVTQTDYLAMLFSYLYGGTIALLGFFVFVYNCIMRGDVMYNWRRICGCSKARNAYAVALPTSPVGSQVGSQVISPVNGHIVQRCQSASSVDSNATNRSANTNQSNHSLKSASRKTSKCNYVPSHTNTGTDASIDSSTPGTVARPHIYEKMRGNGYAHRYHHKARNRPKGHKHTRYSQITARDTSDAGATPDLSSALQPAGYADSVSSGSVMARVAPVRLGTAMERDGNQLGYQPQAASVSSMQSMPAGTSSIQQPHEPPWPGANGTIPPKPHALSTPIVAAHSSSVSLDNNPITDPQQTASTSHVASLDRKEGVVLKRRSSRENTRKGSAKSKNPQSSKAMEESSLQREEVPLLEKPPSLSEPPTYDEVTRIEPLEEQTTNKQTEEAKEIDDVPVFDETALEMDSMNHEQSEQDGSDKRETSV